MGRHSSARQWYFYRSVVLYFLPWALVAAITVTAVWAGVSALGQEELSTDSPAADRQEPRNGNKAPGPDEEPDKGEPTTEPTSSPTGQSSPSPTESPSPQKSPRSKTPLITEDITVQVLNGTAAATADDEVASRLSGLGFDVVAVEPASVSYSRTTVFWSSPGSKDAAEALAQRFGWLADPKPDNLSDSVAVHVVVGADET
jgi:hypothetical protein